MLPLLFLDASGGGAEAWPTYLLGLPLAATTIYLLLPRVPRWYPTFRGLFVVASLVALLAVGILSLRHSGPTLERFLFYAFSLIAVVAGSLLVTQHNPARAALSFALVVLSTCGLFLLQAAPFLMAASIIVYAGAIIVTFLFVLMLAQQEGLSDADQRSREPFLATVAGFVLLGALFYVLASTPGLRAGAGPAPPLSPENVAGLGHNLFTEYLLAVELGGTLLLVATIGAIAITGRRPEEPR